MRIYVDADGFPTAAKDLLIRAAVRLHVPLVFVANKQVRYEPSVIISSIIVPEGPDLADDRIAELAKPGDLVITADIPLADRVVAKGAFALSPRGKFYTEGNIKDRLAMRDLMNELRDGGMDYWNGLEARRRNLRRWFPVHCEAPVCSRARARWR